MTQAEALAELISDEIEARNWPSERLAYEMGGDPVRNQCSVDLLLSAIDGVIPDREMLAQIDRAFGVSDGFLWRVYNRLSAGAGEAAEHE